MPGRLPTSRLVRGGALCVLAATLALAATGANRHLPSAPAPRAVALEPDPERWTVSIDGWIIRVDGIVPETGEEEIESVRPSPLLLSKYDHVIRRHAEAEGLDWRLVAAVISEESAFQADAVSEAGAYGLMQVRPIAAEDVGAVSFHRPDDNVRAGVRYLKKLERRFSAASGRDRLALVLAAYHMGPSHVEDAQQIARRFGFDPNRWENSMDGIVPLLQEPEYYEQAPHGYAQGRLTVLHVYRILTRYDLYRARATAPAPLEEVTQAAATNG